MKKLLFLLLIACNQEQQVKVGRFSIKVFDTIYTPFKTAEEKKEEERHRKWMAGDKKQRIEIDNEKAVGKCFNDEKEKNTDFCKNLHINLEVYKPQKVRSQIHSE